MILGAPGTSFAVASLHRWWEVVGLQIYPEAKSLLICADGGGSNGYRIRLWKVESLPCQGRFANATGLQVFAKLPGGTVCHLPPGTSKWNKIESLASQGWSSNSSALLLLLPVKGFRYRPSRTCPCKARMPMFTQPRSRSQMMSPWPMPRTVQLTPHAFHGEWNYTIAPVSVNTSL